MRGNTFSFSIPESKLFATRSAATGTKPVGYFFFADKLARLGGIQRLEGVSPSRLPHRLSRNKFSNCSIYKIVFTSVEFFGKPLKRGIEFRI
jgi:hypothetical protein